MSLPWGSWLERRGLSAAWVWSGALPGLEGSQGWRQREERACPRGQWEAGAARVSEGGPAALTRPLSPEQPAVHNLALQAGGVCLQLVPKQREPQPRGSHHPHHHEPESDRSVCTTWCAPRGQGRGWALSTVCGAPAPGVRNWPVWVQPQCEALSSAPSLRLRISLRGLFLSSRYSRGPSSERSWDCESRKLRFFPWTSRSSPSLTQGPPSQGWSSKCKGTRWGERCRWRGQHMRGRHLEPHVGQGGWSSQW